MKMNLQKKMNVLFYNALHEEQLLNNIEIKKLRVENVVYMNFKNDFSFKTGDQVLVLENISRH